MIYKAVKDDISAIIELGKLLNDNFENTYLIDNYIDDKNYIILVNKSDKINGFLIVYKNIDYYELEIIVVSSECRNKGIATKLLNYFTNNYCKINDEIFLEVSCENTNAINLYKKIGFDIINIRKKYYGSIDAYIMKKVIE